MSSYLRQGLMSPFWLAALLTKAKSFENPVIGSRWLNEHGLHEARVALAHRIAARRRERLAGLVSAADRATFARDGFLLRENFLPATTFASLLAQVKSYRGAVREMAEGDTINRKIALDRTALAAMPALRDLLGSREWQGLIRYVGSRDTAPGLFLQSIFRHAQDGPDDPQTHLHADSFHPTVKAWFYLTDVAGDAGPFTYVPGSHRLTPARRAWERRMSLTARHAAERYTREGSFRVEPAELEALGLPQPRAFALPANSLVVADTYGFHARGPSLRPSLRVEIFAYGKRCPFLPWTGLDPWSSAGMTARIKLLWRYRDLVEAAGLGRNFMRARSNVSAFDLPG